MSDRGRGPSGAGRSRGRAYARLTKADRLSIERGLDRNESCRAMARGLGRSPSTVHDEVERHRFVWVPRARRGEPAPADAGDSCPRLASWPRCCNGCSKHGGYGCSRSPKVFYRASMAQRAAAAELSEARRGIDEDEGSAAAKIALIRGCTARGLSPEQIVATHPELGLSRSTVYEWIDRGYGDMSNMDLRRKVGYRPRRHAGGRARPTRHSAERSHEAFRALPGDVRDSAWEMDTVEGRRSDTRCLLTLYHRPTSLQLAVPIESQSCQSVLRGLALVTAALGSPEDARAVLGVVLTDNGGEFSDEAALAAAIGERPGEVRLYYCDAHRPDQKGGCERNHSELRKILPKGGRSFDLLTRADCALVMSEVNSEPRGKLAWLTPRDAFLNAFGARGEALLDALGVEAVGVDELDLTPGCLERERGGGAQGR